MLRRITTILLLIGLAGIYAVPLAAAVWPSGASDCCANGMCPRQRAEVKSEPADDAMPDCPMHDQKSTSMSCCKACSCSTPTANAIAVGFYVLPAPERTIFAQTVSQIVGMTSPSARNLSAVPEAPPPRTSLS